MSRHPRPSRRMFPQRVDIQQIATEATDAVAGLTQPVGTIAANVACLISEQRGARRMVGMREVEVKQVRVLFCDPIDLKEGTQIRYTAPSGKVRIFQVNSFGDDLNLGRLWFAECDEQVDPSSGQGTP